MSNCEPTKIAPIEKRNQSDPTLSDTYFWLRIVMIPLITGSTIWLAGECHEPVHQSMVAG
jgi:hypothetical protein